MATPATTAVYVAEIPPVRRYLVHPKSMGSIAFLIAYVLLLWRSTSKQQDATMVILPQESFVSLVAHVHKALLKYVTNKALRLVSLMLVFSKRVFGNMLQGPASLAVDFLARQGVALQDSMQIQFNLFLEKQMDALGEKTKEVVGDPYMPDFIHDIVDDVVDSLVPDAKRLILTKTNELIRYQSPLSHRRKIGHAIVLGPGPGYGGIKPRRDTEEETSPKEVFSLSTFIANGRAQILETVTFPYRWYYQTSQDKQTDAILEEIAEEPVNERDGDSSDDEDEVEMDAAFWSFPYRIRAHLLHISSPCDKSIWQCLRDWRWLFLTALGLAPYGIGTIWWLFMFALLEKRDEYQVCNFIVGFMVSKFLGGCGLLLYGAFKYYLCSTRDVMTCAEDGPRVMEYYDGILFFLQTLLVWLCFFILPMTNPCKYVLDERHAYLVEDMDRVLGRLGTRRPRGGRLVQLFWWDSFCVFVVMGLALFSWGVLGQTGWKLRATLFWLKVLFGLLSLPFLLFKIPVLSTLLMQVRATGYDEWGRVVLHVRVLPSSMKKDDFNEDVTRVERQESIDDKVFESLSDDENEQDSPQDNPAEKLHND